MTSSTDAYQQVQDMERRHQADWNARVYTQRESGDLAARHCDEARVLAYKLAREIIALRATPPTSDSRAVALSILMALDWTGGNSQWNEDTIVRILDAFPSVDAGGESVQNDIAKPVAWIVHADHPFVTMDPPYEGGLPRTPLFARSETAQPVDMLLFCPRCQLQHVDAPEPEKGWTNPPHATHTCKGCGLNWRPSNTLTSGVENIPAQEGKHVARIIASNPNSYTALRSDGGTAKAAEASAYYKNLYHELLFSVGSKWPNETRHQTALRYIQRAEQSNDNRPCQAAPSPNGDD